jgi:hypothetical protein
MEKREIVEQRRYKRFRVKPGAFAIPKARSRKLWQIMDISEGGLAFNYVENGQRPDESYNLDIAYSRDSFYLEDIPYNTVSDFETENTTPLSSLNLRRCGVKFGELKDNQRSQLRDFIQNYTS